MKTKAIIFDFWGTIVENGVYSPVRQVQKILNINMPFSDYIVKMEEALMLRRFNDLYMAFKNVCSAFKVKYNQNQLDILVGMWNRNWMLAKPFPETANVLEELKKNHKLALVSNTDCFSVEPVLEKFNLDKFFDVIVLSYQISMLKTNPEIFNIVMKRLGVKKEETIMIGDSLETDIKGATEAGIRAVLVDRRDRRDYNPKIRNLSEIKKILQ